MGSPLFAELQGSSPGQKESHVKLSLVNASQPGCPAYVAGFAHFVQLGRMTFPKALVRWRRAGKKDQWLQVWCEIGHEGQ